MGRKSAKTKTSKRAKVRKSSRQEDVFDPGGLPPCVSGAVRAFLSMAVERLVWTSDLLEPPSAVKLKWWGQKNGGKLFRPDVIRVPTGSSIDDVVMSVDDPGPSIATYRVRSATQQFTSYLQDMGPLSFDCLDSTSNMVFAKALVSDAVQLVHLKSIKGRYPIVSLDGLSQFGALDVSLSLMRCSAEETSHHGLDEVIVRRPPTAVSPAQIHPPVDTAVSRTAVSSPLHLTDTNKAPARAHLNASESNQHQTSTNNRQSLVPDLGNPSQTREHSSDLLSALIQRGQKLRDNMVLFHVSHSHGKHANDDFKLPVVPLGMDIDVNGSPTYESKDTMEFGAGVDAEMLAAERDIQQRHGLYHLEDVVLDEGGEECVLSDGSVECGVRYGDVSDHDDPLHDESLLEDLFYPATQAKDRAEALTFYATSSDIQLSEDEQSLSGDKQTQLTLPENTIHNVPSAQPAEPLPPTNEVKASSPLTASDKNLTSTSQSEQDPPVAPVLHSVENLRQDGSLADSLDAELLMLLGRVDVARVKVDCLTLNRGMIEEKNQRNKQRCFYIEYKVPVVASSSSQGGPLSMATEVMRVVSRHIMDGVVTFNHHSVFPVLFNAMTINQWIRLTAVFTVYYQSKEDGKPVRIGLARFPMRDLIDADQFAISCQLPVVRTDDVKGERDDKRTVVGQLGLRLELASRNKRWQMANTTAWENRLASKALACQRHQLTRPGIGIEPGIDGTEGRAENSAVIADDSGVLGSTESSSDEVSMPINLLLSIGEAKSVTRSSPDKTLARAINPFLLCRSTLWSEPVKSRVHWNNINPQFSFRHGHPAVLNRHFVHDLRSGIIVVEMWSRHGMDQDELLGVLKLSLNHFYASYRDPELAKAFLVAKYPVIGIDGWCPVINPMTGEQCCKLDVLLAAGSYEQLHLLEQQRSMKTDNSIEENQRFDAVTNTESALATNGYECVEHQLVFTLDTLSYSTSATVYGETDCYIQYAFPKDVSFLEGVSADGEVQFQSHCSATLLSMPELRIDTSFQHRYLLPCGETLQQFLQKAFVTSPATATGGNLSFELWKRYYIPNVRDQLVAKANLPISKLLSVITMHRADTRTSRQHLSLPFSAMTNSTKTERSGTLTLSVAYSHNSAKDLIIATKSMAQSQHVGIRVSILRATGLKAAAEVATHSGNNPDSSFGAGINTYVVCSLLRLGKRTTMVVAKSFCPEFSYHVEYPCPLYMTSSGPWPIENAPSVAEQLIDGFAVFEVYHRPLSGLVTRAPSGGHFKVSDVLIGTVKVALLGLLLSSSGINGHFPIMTPYRLDTRNQQNDNLLSVVGGLEVSLSFANADRQNVQHFLCRVTKEDPFLAVLAQLNSSDAVLINKDQEDVLNRVVVEVRHLQIPLFLLPSGVRGNVEMWIQLNIDGQVDVIQSSSVVMDGSTELLSWDTDGYRQLTFRHFSAWQRFISEGYLDLHVWCRLYDGNHSNERQIGTARVDLADLVRRGVVRGELPIFKSGLDSVYRAGMSVNIQWKQEPLASPKLAERLHSDPTEIPEWSSSSHHADLDLKSNDAISASSPACESGNTPVSEHSDRPAFRKTGPVVDHQSFIAQLEIKRALHINTSGVSEDQTVCVRYHPCQDVDVTSIPLPLQREISWEQKFSVPLPVTLIRPGGDPLILEVQLSTVGADNEVSDLFGIVSVDLTPMAYGLQCICGWYNIVNKAGCCQGQLQVGVEALSCTRTTALSRQAYQTLPLITHYSDGQGGDRIRDSSYVAQLWSELREQMAELDELRRQLLGRTYHTNTEPIVTQCEPPTNTDFSVGQPSYLPDEEVHKTTIPLTLQPQTQHKEMSDQFDEQISHQYDSPCSITAPRLTEQAETHPAFNDSLSVHSSLSPSDTDQDDNSTHVTDQDDDLTHVTSISIESSLSEVTEIQNTDSPRQGTSQLTAIQNTEVTKGVSPVCTDAVSASEANRDTRAEIHKVPLLNTVSEVLPVSDETPLTADCGDLGQEADSEKSDVATPTSLSSSCNSSLAPLHQHKREPVEVRDCEVKREGTPAVEFTQSDCRNDRDCKNGIEEHPTASSVNLQASSPLSSVSSVLESVGRLRPVVSAQPIPSQTPLFFIHVSQLEQSMRKMKSQISYLQKGLPSQPTPPSQQAVDNGSLAKARERIRSQPKACLSMLTPSDLSKQEEDRLSKIFHLET